jgi:hypothetical protein
MGIDKLSRRQLVGMVGAAAALASSGAIAAERKPWAATRSAAPATAPSPAAAIVAPLAAGVRLGRWRVAGVVARSGAVTVGLDDGASPPFYLEVCQRDDEGPVPPARTDRCDVFVANEGDGALPTVEEQGLAAMAVADVVRANEHQSDLSGLMTHRSRLQRFGKEMIRGLD